MKNDNRISANHRSSGMLFSELRRGFDLLCIDVKHAEDILPPIELIENYRLKRAELSEQRENIWRQIHLGNIVNKKNFKKKWKGRSHEHPKFALVGLWFEIGEKIQEIESALTQINDKLHENKELEFSKIFMGVARNLVDENTYNKILIHTERLKSEGFCGTPEEWARFIERI